MGKVKDLILFCIDVIFILFVAAGIFVWIKLGIFFNEHPLPFFAAIVQFICTYACIRVRTMSEFIPPKKIRIINFVAVIYSTIHTIYSSVILVFSYADQTTLYQDQIYFAAYMVAWSIGFAQVLIYLLWPQSLTGVNYAVFQHERELTDDEQDTLDQLEEYLNDLSDSSESKNDNTAEERGYGFEDLGLIHHRNYVPDGTKAEEIWSVWLDPVCEGERIVQTNWNHYFHKQWIKTSYERGNNNCPNCRQLLITGSDVDEKASEENGLLNDSVLTRSSFQTQVN